MSMTIRRLMMLGNVPLPSNVRAYSVVPDQDTFVIEVPHDLGIAPSVAVLLDTYDDAPSANSGGTYAIMSYSNYAGAAHQKLIGKIDNSPAPGFYVANMVDPVSSSLSVTFTRSQYYNITWKANHTLICILLANHPTA